ncbi:MAG: FKBP-type peptidyl-prolyl cis-trans isomerase [Proteobacteria bacterium]|nr:FKBP-type peptidyl-prolyl cis-trans isomerase [Pseudomonadota bacterium]MBU1419408.1 FKBP-type peptidyl-prolyl cis-trans isomerase [Pseudomonadota bacterium]MBU1454248.1 FKBP-type peptidyl-prolyl cis-trans isomerase [Pseudomonadota bacterium]
MKRIVGMALFACLIVPGQIQAKDAVKADELKTFEEKLSYSLGLDVGAYFKGMGEDLNYEILVQGLGDSFHGNPPLLTQDEMQAVQSEFSEKMQAKQEAQLKELQEQNKKAGDEYLAKNKEKKGVIVTASGLQYEIVKEGTGATPKAEDTVKVHYRGTKVDGTVFDDSYKRGEPAVFGVNQVIPGWTETLQLMKEGSTFKVAIPSSLAYGDQGVPPMIEPNSVLIFDVELISIEKPATE